MSSFSRSMPPRETLGPAGRGLALGSLLGFLALPGLLSWPLGLVLPTVFLLATWSGRRRDARLAEERQGESLCTFARSFERRSVDPWILRGVYEGLESGFPLRASDRLLEELRLEAEDLEDEAVAIAERAGRSLAGAAANARFGRLESVRDLVLFLQDQPRERRARPLGGSA